MTDHLTPTLSLRLAILTMDEGNRSNQLLTAAVKVQNHHIELLSTSSCHLVFNSKGMNVYRGNQNLTSNFDAIIPRIGPKITTYGTSLIRQFEANGVYCLNSAKSIIQSRNKLLAQQVLISQNIAMPKTAMAISSDSTEQAIEHAGGLPVVIKPQISSRGENIELATTLEQAKTIISTYQANNQAYLIQQFIKEANGADIRCLVLGNQLIASMQRQAKPGDFRANIHQGAKAKNIEISPEERQIAIKASQAFGLGLAGVDILRSSNGPLVLEVNSSPGLNTIGQVTGLDLAGNIIKHIANEISKASRSGAKD